MNLFNYFVYQEFENGDVLFGPSGSWYKGFGGYYSVQFNASEFLVRLFK